MTMKKTLCLLAAIALTGCASVGDGVNVETIYRAPVFGDAIDDVKVIEDSVRGIVIYVRVGAQGNTEMRLLLKPESKLVPVAGK